MVGPLDHHAYRTFAQERVESLQTTMRASRRAKLRREERRRRLAQRGASSSTYIGRDALVGARLTSAYSLVVAMVSGGRFGR
jgi:hypothetical protein